MDKHELIKTVVTVIIAVTTKELLSWLLVKASKKLAHRRQGTRTDSALDAGKD